MGLIYAVNLDKPKSTDVIKRVLKLEVDGVETITELAISAKPKQHLLDPVKDGAEVTVSVQDIDDAGNASEWWTTRFVAKDTLPPEAPGGITVTLVQEVDDAPTEVIDTPPVVVEGEAVVTPLSLIEELPES